MRFLHNTRLYTKQAWWETFRTRRTLLTIVVIVCGCTVPLAILQGFTDGLVKQQEADFLKSPSAIQIAVAATGASGPLTAELERELLTYPAIAAVIPDTTKVVDLASDATHEQSGVTLRATQAGDPLLAFFDADVLTNDVLTNHVLTNSEPGLVVSRYLADQLALPDVDPVDAAANPPSVTMSVARQTDDGTERVELVLPVMAVIDLGTAAPIAYAHRGVLEAIDAYQAGQAVSQYAWPGLNRPAPVAYEAMLAFSKTPFSQIDRVKLKAHGLAARPLTAADSDQEAQRLLGGVLKSHDLFVYRLAADGADPAAATPRLSLTASHVEQMTDADDIIVVWSTPERLPIDFEIAEVVGVTLRKRWLKSYLKEPALVFGTQDDERQLRWLGQHAMTGSVVAELGNDIEITLATGSPAPTAAPSPTEASHQAIELWERLKRGYAAVVAPVSSANDDVTSPEPVVTPATRVAIVPAAFLAHVKAVRRGEVTFDAQSGLFVAVRSEPAHYQARVVATDIHAVPIADKILRDHGFASQSQRTRVEELQQYSRTLSLLVYVVGGTVLFFGIWTLTAALAENTDRKRRALGTLRMLGIGRLGVAYIVIVRAVLIGLVAGAITVPTAIGLSQWLTNSVAACLISPTHLAIVFGIAVLACLVGAWLPAVMAARTAPADVLRHGAAQ